MDEQHENPMNPSDVQPFGQPAPSGAQPVQITAEPFRANFTDGIFALFAFILGYFFARWVLTSWQGWGVAVFTAVYLLSVTIYFYKKGIRFDAAAWFWLAVTFLTGLSYAFWTEIGLMPLRALFLFCSAVYWVMSAARTQIAGKSGNYLLLDGINTVIVIPFRNIINQYRSFGALKKKNSRGNKKGLSVLIGIVLALLVTAIIVPLLLRADSGGFSKIFDAVARIISFDIARIMEFVLYCVLAVPVAAYLFGLVSGSAAHRGTKTFTLEKTEKTVYSLRILHPATVLTVLGTACVVYVVFIASQLPYFFSAFSGNRPDGWLAYSEYARRGFFELCQIAAINLILLICANILSKKQRSESGILKIFNVVLSLITLLLLATAFSKLALYIHAFGLSMMRLLPCVFMIFLAVIFIAVIALQKWKFSIVRLSLVTGAVLFAAFCMTNPDGQVVRYNTDRYIAGTLSDYDVTILERAGSAGVIPALEVYDKTTDETLKSEIAVYLKDQKDNLSKIAGTHRDNVQNENAWSKLKDVNLG